LPYKWLTTPNHGKSTNRGWKTSPTAAAAAPQLLGSHGQTSIEKTVKSRRKKKCVSAENGYPLVN